MTITKLTADRASRGIVVSPRGTDLSQDLRYSVRSGSGHPQQDDIQQMFSAMRDEMLQVSIGI